MLLVTEMVESSYTIKYITTANQCGITGRKYDNVRCKVKNTNLESEDVNSCSVNCYNEKNVFIMTN